METIFYLYKCLNVNKSCDLWKDRMAPGSCANCWPYSAVQLGLNPFFQTSKYAQAATQLIKSVIVI